MKKERVEALMTAGRHACHVFSGRARNPVDFSLKEMTPLSESTAVMVADKTDGTQALFFFFCLRMKDRDSGEWEDKWQFFLPTTDHVLGMMKVADHLQTLEEVNFKLRTANHGEGQDTVPDPDDDLPY